MLTAGLVLRGPHDAKASYALKFRCGASNNEVEYEALIARSKLTKYVRDEKINIFSNFMLVVQ